MSKKILIIKTGTTIESLLARQEDFEDWFIRGTGLEADNFICCAVDEGEPLPVFDAVAAAIVTGSPAYVTDLAPWNEIAADYLRALHAQQKPILGVCYGHQLLAWAFGGEVGFHSFGREIGTVDIELSAEAAKDALFVDVPRVFKAQASHLQSVLALPDEAVLLAKNSFEPNHAFRLGASTWGVQFHPEFSAPIMSAYIRERSDAINEEGLDAESLLNRVSDTPISAGLLRQFAGLIDI
ncbi:MAG: GMP synthase [Pseudohongiella sp.]|nr:MAG: GMP synthase [Pseudohongiella sp.]